MKTKSLLLAITLIAVSQTLDHGQRVGRSRRYDYCGFEGAGLRMVQTGNAR